MTDPFAEKARVWNKDPARIRAISTFTDRVKSIAPIGLHDRVMDLGCGTGTAGLNLINEVGCICFVDPSKAMLDVLKESIIEKGVENFEIYEGEIDQFNGSPVDLVMSHMAFHHAEDIDDLVKKIHNVLKIGGKAVVVDVHTEDGSFHGEMKVPHNGFDVEILKSQFIRAGFKRVLSEDYPAHVKKRENQPDQEYPRFVILAEK